MSPFMRAVSLALSISAVMALGGCGDDVLDWRNAQLSNGKVFKGSANKPFSGKVTNVPYAKVLGAQPGYQQLMGQGASIVTMLFGSALLCDAKVDDGVLDGDVVCRRSQQKDHEIETRFDDGVLEGKFVMRDANTNNVVVETNFKDGKLDGTLKRYDPKTKAPTLEQSIAAGVADGPFKQWDPVSGKLLVDANYSKGYLDGKYLQNDKFGNQVAKGSYKSDVFTGARIDDDYVNGEPNPDYLIARITEQIVGNQVANQPEVDAMRSHANRVRNCVDGLNNLRSDQDRELGGLRRTDGRLSR